MVSPVISTLLWLAALVLAMVFAIAAAAKIRDREHARQSLVTFGVPQAWAGAALALLVVLEASAAALLLYSPTRLLGAAVAAIALSVFTLAIGWQLLRGKQVSCACFGALSEAPVGWRSIVRNGLLLGFALALLALPAASATPTLPSGIAPLTLLALAWLAFSSAWLVLLTRQNGRLILRLEQLEGHSDAPTPLSPAAPLQLGAIVPPLGLRDRRGRMVDLQQLRGSSLLLLFLDSNCTHCSQVLAQLRMVQPGDTTLVIIRDTEMLPHALPPEILVLHDPAWSTMTLFQLRGTPAAVLVDADGRMAERAVHGTSAVLAAIEHATTREVRHELAPV